MKMLLRSVMQAPRAKWLLVMLLSTTIFSVANATHFRYGTITWQRDLSYVSPTSTKFLFTVKSSWRWSFYGNPSIGSTVSSGMTIIVNGTGFSTSSSMNMTITNTNPSEDYLDAVYTFSAIVPNTGFPFTAFFESCCRISTLKNNNDGNFRVETIIPNGDNNSPVASIPAIINMPVDVAAATYPISAVDPDGDPITLTLANPATFGGGTQPAGLSVSGMNLVFDTRTAVYPTRTAGTVWNAVLNVKDNKGATIALDVVIKITGASTPPQFVYPPTPANTSQINVRPGNIVSFQVRASDADAGDIVTLTGAGFPTGVAFAATSGGTANATFTWTPTNAQIGTYVVVFSATDVAGVVRTSSVTIRVSVDPEFIAPTLGDGSTLCATPGDPVTATFAARDLNVTNTVSLSAVSGLIPGMVFAPTIPTGFSNPVQTDLSWTPAAADWGAKTLVMKATNQVGYFKTTSLTWVVDTRPVITSTPPTNTLVVGQPFSYTLVATDADIPFGDHVDIETSVLPSFLSIVDNGNNTFTISGTPTVADIGNHSVDVELEDALNHYNLTHCGNVHQTFSLQVVPCNLNVTLTSNPPLCAGGNDGSVLSNATGVNGTAVYAWSNGATTADITNVAEGSYSLTVTDDYGCSATASTTLAAPADVTPPTFLTPAVITTPTNGSGQVTATSIVGAVVNYVNPTATDNCNPSAVTVSCVPVSGSVFPIGTTTVTCVARDGANNPTISTFDVVVIGAAPSITCPGNINVNATAGQCGAIVNFAATETAGIPASTITYSHAPGSFFNVGTTTVTATATNNIGTDQCTFTVTVVDNQPPTFTSTAVITTPTNSLGQVSATSPVGAVVNYIAPQATDNCDPSSVTVICMPPSGSVFPIGTSTVVCTATDINNLQTNSTFTINVVGGAPDIVCPGNITVNAAAGQCGANVNFAATETVGIPASTITYSHAPGSFFPVGTNTVTATATNSVGTDQCTFTVTVKDVQAPVLTGVPSNATVLCNAIPAPAAVTASDNCATSLPVVFKQVSTPGAMTANGLQGLWQFDETSGSTSVDGSGNGNTASLTSNVTRVAGYSGNAVAFPGTSNTYVQIPNATGGVLDTRYSLSMFARFIPGTNGAQQMPIIQFNQSGWGCHLWQTGPNQLFVRFTRRGDLAFTTSLAANVLIPGQWNCVGATYDYATGIARLWHNGVVVQTLNIGQMELSTNYPVRVGSVDFDGRRTNGQVDNVVIYDRAISAAEVASLCAASCPQNYTITRTWTATDASNNKSSGQQVLTVQDNVAPVITCPANITVSNDAGQCGANVNFAATATDNCSTFNITYSKAPGSFFPTGTTTVTATATDACGNASTCSFTVTVNDTQAPSITCAAPVTINNTPGLCTGTVTLTKPTVTDNCSTFIIPTEMVLNGGFASGSSSWNACGNIVEAFCAETCYGGPNGSNRVAEIDPDVNSSTSDDRSLCQTISGFVVGKRYKLTFLASRRSGGTPPTVGAIVTVDGGALNVTVNRSNVSFNFTQETFTFIATQTTHQLKMVPSAQTGFGLGLIVDDISIKIDDGTITNNAPATYPVGNTTVVWTATDAYGNSAVCNQIVTVRDNEIPVITTNGNKTANSAAGLCSASVTVNASATDNCGVGAPTGVRNDGLALTDAYPVGTTTITWNVTDIHGNPATTVTQTVVVTDNEIPVITTNGNKSVNNDGGTCGAAVDVNATASDNCSVGAPTGVRSDGLALTDAYPVGTTTITWNVTDIHGNPATAVTQTVVVTDNELPVITTNGNKNVNNDVDVCGAAVIVSASATDNCGVGTPTGVRSDGLALTDVYPVGTTTITWNVTDIHGNPATAVTQTVVVTDNQIPVITTNGNKSVNNDAGVCGAAVTVSASATDNCSVGSPSGVRSDGKALNAIYPVGTTTITWNVTDVNGNPATAVTQTVVVTDNEKPIVTCPGTQRFCSVAAGTYTIPALVASDNCGILSVTYQVTGVTTRSGSGYDASGAFAIGNSTITWTVTDINGNVNNCSTQVTIWPLPVASISTSNADAFCNKLTVTASSTLSGPFSFAWKFAGSPFANTQSIQLGNANGDGTYSVWATDGNGCTSASPATFVYLKQNYISNYTILGLKKVEVGEYNVVHGSVGNMDLKYKTEIKKYATVSDPGAFVKGVDLDIDANATVPNRIYAPVALTLPTMQYNTSSTSGLPNYTVPDNTTITLNGNYKDIKIKKGSNVTLTGTVFGKVDIEEGSYVKFTSSTVNISDMRVGKGPNNGYTYVAFAGNTSVRVSKRVDVEEDCIINPNGYNVTFYMGDTEKDKEKFTVKKGRNTTVNANIYIPIGKLEIKKATANESCTMTGTFIAEDVDGDSKYVTWNGYDCNVAAAPEANFAGVMETPTVAVNLGQDKVGLKVNISPNPTLYQWTIRLQSNVQQPVSIRILNGLGQVVDGVSKTDPNSTVQLGAKLRSGAYMAEVIQGNSRQMIHLIKGN